MVRTKRILIPKVNSGEFLLIRMGDHRNGSYPSDEDMSYVGKVFEEAMKTKDSVVVVPYDVRVQKIRIGKVK